MSQGVEWPRLHVRVGHGPVLQVLLAARPDVVRTVVTAAAGHSDGLPAQHNTTPARVNELH